jgi:environmental stress-induced protein Ves
MTRSPTIWTAPGGHRVMPWKNGLGETLEVARHPEGSSLEAFEWRISVAPVVADGAFSVFPGVERTIVVVEGAGMELSMAGGKMHVLRPGVPFSFDGGTTIVGRLIDGPVRDFNVMVRRDRCTGELILCEGPAAIAALGATQVAFAVSGAWHIEADADGGRLEPGASVLTTAAVLTVRPQDAGTRLAIAVLRSA